MSEETEYEQQKEENKQSIIAMGFEYGADIIPEDISTDPRVIKVNLPEYAVGPWRTGNGEGIWAYIRNAEDVEKYNNASGPFDVVLMNHSFYYMGLLCWGSVIKVVGTRRDTRPVIDKEWLDEAIARVDAMNAAAQEAANEDERLESLPE